MAGFHKRLERTRQSGYNNGKSGPAVQDPAAQPPKHAEDTTSTPGSRCPQCGSERLYRDGLRYPRSNEGPPVQRLLCRDCGFRFSESTLQRQEEVNILGKPGETPHSRSDVFKAEVHEGNLSGDKPAYEPSLVFGEDVGSHGVTVVGKSINSFRRYNSNCRVRVLEGEAKNLAQVEPQTEKAGAGATKLSPEEVKGKIVEFAWWMKKQGHAETTVRVNTTVVRVLAERGADIFNPDSVKEAIAKQKWSEARRHTAIAAYTLLLKMLRQTWEPPVCKVTRKLPFIPTEEEIDALIAGCGNKTATFLQLLKETAMRAGEANRLLWTNIDMERRTITLNSPEKGGNSRIWKVSNKLIAMLNALPKTSIRVFGDSPTSYKKSCFYQARKSLTWKLQNPRLLRISFHTLRHWKATMLYHQTKDILYVKEFLGHRKVETTLLYIQLAEAIFKETTDEFTVRVASKPEEITQLLEVGFDFVCEKDGMLYFRKRK